MIEPLAWLLLLLPGIATLVLLVELAAAQFPLRRLPSVAGPRFTIVVPAHDETALIGAAVAALRAAAPDARLLVVADNCSDDTAMSARAAGAEVIERHDPARHGKDHALAFARAHLAPDPPDVIVVVDADCTIDEGGPARLAATAQATGRPVQSCYLMRPRPERGALVALSGFAFLVRNLVRQRGLARLGAPALLTGSGMALPWAAFAAAPLASGHLVEDFAQGIALSRAGQFPLFLSDVRTWSDPARPGATRGQRARWEHGFLRTALTNALPLIATRRWPCMWLGLHLLVMPLALLLMIDLIVLAALAWLGAALPLAVLALLLAGAALLLGLSWARFGRAQISGRQLLLIPVYVVWKLPLYLMGILRPERRWRRTERD